MATSQTSPHPTHDRGVMVEKTGRDVPLAATLIQEGKLVAIPTETVYGLAANALNLDAVTAIFQAKNRPFFDPLIVHVLNLDAAQALSSGFPKLALQLAERFWPGPLTLLVPKSATVHDLVTAGSDRVALRVPSHPMVRDLLKACQLPLAAPSANPFGYVSPTTAQHVADQLGDSVSYILDGGPSSIGIESTIVGFDPHPVVYRLGGIPVEDIEDVIGPVEVKAHSTSNPQAPGMLASHYAPRTPLFLGTRQDIIAHLGEQKNPSGWGAICFTEGLHMNLEREIILSASGNLNEAAQNVFSALRQLDNSGLRGIVAELLPEKGLGRAVNDRLQRAAVKRQ